MPSAAAEDADREASLMADAVWAREACAFITFMFNMVRNFVAAETMLLACIATLRYVAVFVLVIGHLSLH